jgi:methylenetetrahydrofolate--tRNA-(uracil-5-)-methyltransferase
VLGGLMRYLRESEPGRFQPMNSNWGLLDPLPDPVRDKRAKREALARRAQADLATWMGEHGLVGAAPATAARE